MEGERTDIRGSWDTYCRRMQLAATTLLIGVMALAPSAAAGPPATSPSSDIVWPERTDFTSSVEMTRGQSVKVAGEVTFVFKTGEHRYATLPGDLVRLLEEGPALNAPSGLRVAIDSIKAFAVDVDAGDALARQLELRKSGEPVDPSALMPGSRLVSTGYQVRCCLTIAADAQLTPGKYQVVMSLPAVPRVAKALGASSPAASPTYRIDVQVFDSAQSFEQFAAERRRNSPAPEQVTLINGPKDVINGVGVQFSGSVQFVFVSGVNRYKVRDTDSLIRDFRLDHAPNLRVGVDEVTIQEVTVETRSDRYKYSHQEYLIRAKVSVHVPPSAPPGEQTIVLSFPNIVEAGRRFGAAPTNSAMKFTFNTFVSEDARSAHRWWTRALYAVGFLIGGIIVAGGILSNSPPNHPTAAVVAGASLIFAAGLAGFLYHIGYLGMNLWPESATAVVVTAIVLNVIVALVGLTVIRGNDNDARFIGRAAGLVILGAGAVWITGRIWQESTPYCDRLMFALRAILPAFLTVYVAALSRLTRRPPFRGEPSASAR